MKHLSVIVITFLLIVSITISAGAVVVEKNKVGENVVFKDSDWAYEKVHTYGYEINEYIGINNEPSVPYSFAKEYITSIGSYAFNNKSVKKVETTYKIESIGEYAFNGCNSLEKIILYNSVTTLGVGCFYGCNSLSDINLEETSIGTISAYCFADCGIETIEIPQTCTSIKNSAFYNCNSLTRVVIPDSVTEIADNAFNGCSEDMVIICDSNSYAAQYAAAKNITVLKTDDPQMGDANADGSVNILDVTAIQKYKIGTQELTEYGLRCADTDHNGTVTIRDATLIQMYLAHMINDF